MSSWDAIILGLVEGLTEYLPVSSTGHLLFAQRLLGIAHTAAADSYAVSIQLGAILAVLVVYSTRISQMMYGLIGRDAEGRRLLVNVMVGFFPAAVIGFLLEKTIKSYLFGLNVVIVSWAAWGLVILVVFLRRRITRPDPGNTLEMLSWRGALIIGLFQCLAMIPGTSRSLVTILGAIFVGLSLPSAVEFSFLLGVVTLGAATAYDLVFHFGSMNAEYGFEPILLGLLVSFVAGISAIKWMVSYLSRHDMAVFGWYRLIIAAIALILMQTGFVSS